jgi:hypothetical protein
MRSIVGAGLLVVCSVACGPSGSGGAGGGSALGGGGATGGGSASGGSGETGGGGPTGGGATATGGGGGVNDAGIDAGIDAGSADSGVDAGLPDAGLPDAGLPDAGLPDAGLPDAGLPDAGTDGGWDAGFMPPLQFPLDGGYDNWTWIPLTGMQCANGSPTGIGVNPHLDTGGQLSTKVLVWLQGGGGCGDFVSCGGLGDAGPPPGAQNLNGFGLCAPSCAPGQTDFFDYLAFLGSMGGGVFDRTNPDNPFRDFNLVFVPYCTGDEHSGARTNVYPAPDGGPGLAIHHAGYTNVGVALGTIVPTFSNATLVSWTGSSAGAFGAVVTYGRALQAFKLASSPSVTLVCDASAGVSLRPPYNTKAFQAALYGAWGTLSNLPVSCPLCDPTVPDGGIHNLWTAYAADPAFRGSYVSSIRDENQSARLANPVLGNPAMVCSPIDFTTPCLFPTGVHDFEDNVASKASPGRIRVFLMNHYFHTWLHRSLEWGACNDVTLADFLRQQLADDPQWVSRVPCSDLGNSFTPANESMAPGQPMPPTFGTPTPGLYQRVTDTFYGAGYVSIGAEELLKIIPADAGQYWVQTVLQLDAGHAPITGINYLGSLVDGGVMLQQVCPDAGVSLTVPYTASPSLLTLYRLVGMKPDGGPAGARVVDYALLDGG